MSDWEEVPGDWEEAGNDSSQDMGPAARRAMSGRGMPMREPAPDDDATVYRQDLSLPQKIGSSTALSGVLAPKGTPVLPPEIRDRNQPTAHDPLAQMIIGGMAGGAMGNAVRPLLGSLGPAAPFVGAATEGATAAQVTGGDPRLGAALGLIFPALGLAGKGAERALSNTAGGRAQAVVDAGPPVSTFNPSSPVKGGALDGMAAEQAIATLERAKGGAPHADIDAAIAKIRAEATSAPSAEAASTYGAARSAVTPEIDLKSYMPHGLAAMGLHQLGVGNKVLVPLAILMAAMKNLPAAEAAGLTMARSAQQVPAWTAPTFGAAAGER